MLLAAADPAIQEAAARALVGVLALVALGWALTRLGTPPSPPGPPR
jgi:hypothetical protein